MMGAIATDLAMALDPVAMLARVGLCADPCQARDHTALAIVEQPLWVPEHVDLNLAMMRHGWVSPAALTGHQRHAARWPWKDRPGCPTLAVGHRQRWPPGTGDPDIARDVARLLARPPLHGAEVTLIVDATREDQRRRYAF